LINLMQLLRWSATPTQTCCASQSGAIDEKASAHPVVRRYKCSTGVGRTLSRQVSVQDASNISLVEW
jgi:hypothetical protein